MEVQIALLIIGLALIIFGADWLVDGASAIAKKLGVSDFVIGLTIVGFGTSCPELVVSLTGAFAGNSDISIGNVVGSNIFNSLPILGITALIMPISITAQNRKRDIPLTIAVTLMLLCMGMGTTLFKLGNGDGLSRIEGLVFLAVFALYLFYCFKSDAQVEEAEETAKNIGIFKAVLLCIAGLAGLVLGGRWFVSSASYLARVLGVSDKFIAITILAGGTSLPELATCIVAAAKKKGQLALGNILGSNIFNILLILGCSAVVYPLSFEGINFVDMGTLLLSALLVLFSAFTGRNNKVDRFDGTLMILCYAAYMVWLFKTI